MPAVFGVAAAVLKVQGFGRFEKAGWSSPGSLLPSCLLGGSSVLAVFVPGVGRSVGDIGPTDSNKAYKSPLQVMPGSVSPRHGAFVSDRLILAGLIGMKRKPRRHFLRSDSGSDWHGNQTEGTGNFGRTGGSICQGDGPAHQFLRPGDIGTGQGSIHPRPDRAK